MAINVQDKKDPSLTIIVTEKVPNIVKVEKTKDLEVTISGGLNGLRADANYVHTQPVPAAVWHIVHNLNKFASVIIVDSSKKIVIGEVQYISENAIDVTFSGAFSGFAFVN